MNIQSDLSYHKTFLFLKKVQKHLQLIQIRNCSFKPKNFDIGGALFNLNSDAQNIDT